MTEAIVVLGDALLDVRAVPNGPVDRGSDVPARIGVGPGGQGANVAVRLARQGIAVTLVAGLADDAAGGLVRAGLEADGVVLRPLEVPATGSVIVLGEAGGERTMLSDRAPFAHLVDAAALPAAGWLIVSGYLLHEPAAVELCARLATLDIRRVLVGCAVRDDRVAGWRAAAGALRPDLLVLNRDEASRLAPAGEENLAVTDATGASLRIGGLGVRSLTPAAAPAIDTTGAGDAFAATLVAGLAASAWPPSREAMQDALEAAVALAGRVVRVVGAQGRVAGERGATLTA